MLIINRPQKDNLELLSNQSSLLIFLYLVNIKDEQVAMLIQFLQKYDINFGKICTFWKINVPEFVMLITDTKSNSYESHVGEPFDLWNKSVKDLYKFLSTKANYVAHSQRMISAEEFQQISQYLVSITTVVVFFYQNKIWDLPRLGSSSEKNTLDKTWESLSQTRF